MQNIADKADSTAGATGELTAAEYNSHKNELQGAVTRSGQTLSAATLLQLAKALFINGVGAEACIDSGSVNSILLSPNTGASGLVVPDNYSELEGAILSFTKADINTSTAVTVNFGQTGTELGAKSLVRTDGTVPAVGDVIGRCLVQWDNSADKWVLISNETDTYKYDVSSAGGALAPKFSNNIAEVDASLGNVSITLADPEFVGQRIRIFANGTGIVDVAGTGLYANNVYITENTGGMSAEAVEIGGAYEWRADNGVTADYVSGTTRVEQTSAGKAIVSLEVSGTSSSAAPNYYGTTSGTTYYNLFSASSFIITFAAVPTKYRTGVTQNATGVTLKNITASSLQFQVTGQVSGTTVVASAVVEGDY